MIFLENLSAIRPPKNAPIPNPAIKTETMTVIEVKSTPKPVNNNLCQQT